MIPSINPISINKYIDINIKLCRPILRNIFLKNDQFTPLYVSSKINYICVCIYSVFRRAQHNCASKVTSVGLFTQFFHTFLYVYYRSDDGPQIGKHWLPWKHNCVVYDGIPNKYIYKSEHNGDVSPRDY